MTEDQTAISPPPANAPDNGANGPLSAQAAIETLFVRHIHGTRLCNDTELYNLVFAFKEDLKANLPAASR